MKLILAVAAAAAAVGTFGVFASTAVAYDRPPISIYGLRPDGWGDSVTGAERSLQQRYAGISTTYCMGVTMNGYPTASSAWVHGMTRFWDKEVCFGKTYSGAIFGLIYDAKGRYAWVIYRLKGATVLDLQGR